MTDTRGHWHARIQPQHLWGQEANMQCKETGKGFWGRRWGASVLALQLYSQVAGGRTLLPTLRTLKCLPALASACLWQGFSRNRNPGEPTWFSGAPLYSFPHGPAATKGQNSF